MLNWKMTTAHESSEAENVNAGKLRSHSIVKTVGRKHVAEMYFIITYSYCIIYSNNDQYRINQSVVYIDFLHTRIIDL